jgi:aspartate/methionine/tyrosine aminotransferase
LNFPSNPTGGVATRDQLEDIANVIIKKCKKDMRVYSDEVYENILFDGSKHISIASMPKMAERTIIVSGVSKSYSWTGGRIGWAVFPTEEEALVFKNLNINYFSCVPAYNQEGAREALESRFSELSIREMVEAFQARRDVVIKNLSAVKGISCQNPKGAFYVFPNISGVCENLGVIDAFEALPKDIRAKTSPSTLFQMFLLFRYRVASMDRKSFGRIGSEGKHYLRLSIATGIEDLKEAVKRIELAAADKPGFAEFIREGKRFY